jgi:hypothetical protein
MRSLKLLMTAALVLFTAHGFAGTIPYANIGAVAPTSTFTADATGDITGYLVQGGQAEGGTAADTDYIEMIDVTTGTSSGWLFDSQTTPVGASANFGDVTAGDVLEFELLNASLSSRISSNVILSSNPADSRDGLNHAYSAPWTGSTLNGVYIPAGTYIGFEDEPAIFGSQQSDFNYDDEAIVIENDAALTIAAPEPGSFCLLGTGLLGLIAIGRRKLRG